MDDNTVEISIGGYWRRVPALELEGRVIALRGSWLTLAVIKDEDFIETELTNPDVYVDVLKQRRFNGVPADIFTFAQKLPATQVKYSYPVEWESVAAASTTTFQAWWERLPQETRKNVRRSAKRGVTVGVRPLDDDLVRDICELNNDSPVRQGRSFVHYGKSFAEVKRDQLPLLDRSEYICAYCGAELVGFLKVAYAGRIAAIIQVLPKASHHDKRPANALIAKAVERCEARGAAYLTYGLFNQSYRRENPLTEFKARNGFEEMLVPRYYVPLTALGRLCVPLGLYRGIRGMARFLPGPVVQIAADARSRWHRIAAKRAGVTQ